MMTIEEFCDRHGACADGRDWALANCHDLPHAWETIRPDWLVWMATCPGVLDDRTLRRFAVWCARHVQHLMKDQRSLDALDVAERYTEGRATDDELRAARAAAWAAKDAARDAARTAARAAKDAAWFAAASAGYAAAWAAEGAARAAAWAAKDAARDAAASAGYAAEWAAEGAAEWAARAARAAARDAARDAALDAARAAQAAWLRENAKPNWEDKP